MNLVLQTSESKRHKSSNSSGTRIEKEIKRSCCGEVPIRGRRLNLNFLASKNLVTLCCGAETLGGVASHTHVESIFCPTFRDPKYQRS